MNHVVLIMGDAPPPPSRGQVVAIEVIFIAILLYAVVFFTVLALATRWDRVEEAGDV